MAYQMDEDGSVRLPMWALRGFVDEQMKMIGDAALQHYPVDVEEIEIAGVRCHLVKPKEIPLENQGLTLMNLHGGGFVMGSGSLIEAMPHAHWYTFHLPEAQEAIGIMSDFFPRRLCGARN